MYISHCQTLLNREMSDAELFKNTHDEKTLFLVLFLLPVTTTVRKKHTGEREKSEYQTHIKMIYLIG